jgi:hypothetical protein
VSQPDYAQAVAKAVHEVPVATWKLYFRARVMDANANLLAKPWRDAHFAFHGKALSGSEQPKPRWQQGIDALDGALGEAVGQQYVARYFPADHKARMQELVANLLKAYGESIDGLTWMSPATKVKAREKLSKYATKIGYPDKWRDYSGLVVKEGDPVGNAERAGRFEFKRVAAKLGQPVDRSEWLMSPQTVNAYYNPSMNEIVFPAAILEPPFFDMAADDAANYGAIGAIIGHEISHGFDDQGRSTTATASWTTGGRRKMPRPSPPWASSWWRSSPATSPAGPQGQRPADPGREHRRPVGPADRLQGLEAVAEWRHATGDQRPDRRAALLLQLRPCLALQVPRGAAAAPADRRPALAAGIPRQRHGDQPRRLPGGLRRQAGRQDVQGAAGPHPHLVMRRSAPDGLRR